MSKPLHQYALFGTAQFKYDQTIAHTSDPHRQIVICNNGSDVRYATLEEWEEAGALFDERARIEGIVTSASPARDKLELFRSLFTGRKDVYAHGYRRKDGGIGYTPACANEWKSGICPKAAHQRVKCAECGNRIFPELSDAAIIAHFKGNDDRFRDVLGQYVLDRDCNTKVLVIDFDKADWKEATNAVRLVAKRRSINAAVERSRSGNGAHIWFFFLEPIDAKAAREFGSYLITEAAVLNKTITFEAFDRMLPAQVTIPDGGFGNLIALPFQGKAQREGNSVFVDEQFEPFPDQWLYLSQVQLIPRSTVQNLIETTGDNPHGLATVTVANKTKRYAQTPRKRLPLTSRDFPSSLPVTQADMLYIPEKSLSPAAQMEIRGLATFANPEFFRAQSMHQSVFGKPRLIDLSELRGGCVAIPRGCKAQLDDLGNGFSVHYSDDRKSDNQIVMTFKGALRPEQQIAADQMLIYEDGIMSAPTGFGKTVIGAYLIAAIGLPTLVIVPKTALITQWKSQLERFVDITDNREPVRTPKGRI
ncbi:MAG: TOTE conflict system archaeo-eukaryotic primase domain-containing protein, partial [Collinsella sp.]